MELLTTFAAADFLGTPAWISLSVTVGLLAAGVLYSLYRTRGGAVPELQPRH
jgi:hypothetical protein